MCTGNYFLLIPLIIVLFSVAVAEVLLDPEIDLLVPLKSTLDKEGRHFRSEHTRTHAHGPHRTARRPAGPLEAAQRGTAEHWLQRH